MYFNLALHKEMFIHMCTFYLLTVQHLTLCHCNSSHVLTFAVRHIASALSPVTLTFVS